MEKNLKNIKNVATCTKRTNNSSIVNATDRIETQPKKKFSSNISYRIYVRENRAMFAIKLCCYEFRETESTDVKTVTVGNSF